MCNSKFMKYHVSRFRNIKHKHRTSRGCWGNGIVVCTVIAGNINLRIRQGNLDRINISRNHGSHAQKNYVIF